MTCVWKWYWEGIFKSKNLFQTIVAFDTIDERRLTMWMESRRKHLNWSMKQNGSHCSTSATKSGKLTPYLSEYTKKDLYSSL